MKIDPLIASYRELGKTLNGAKPAADADDLLCRTVSMSLRGLEKCKHDPLLSKVPGKQYFRFTHQGKFSRAVNSALWDESHDRVYGNLARILEGNTPEMTALEINRALYTSAISFCCMIDLLKLRDQKTPGTFFEYLMKSVFTKTLGVEAQNSIEVLNLDQKGKLPTDFIFDLGKKKPKFHVPVKTSTRERVIQLWAHQRVLDGVYGVGRFFGMPMILTETKTDAKKKEVTEICLPLQWRLYQMYISQMWRICYLDLPAKYDQLAHEFPMIPVTTIGDILAESSDLREMIKV